MDITERYTTKNGRQYLIRLSYNERIKDIDPGSEFVNSVEILDAESRLAINAPMNTSRFSTYENFTSFGGYCAINYFGVRETAIEGLRTKILTRIEDHLERLA